MQAATESVAVAPTAPVARPAKPRARMMRQYDLVERVRNRVEDSTRSRSFSMPRNTNVKTSDNSKTSITVGISTKP